MNLNQHSQNSWFTFLLAARCALNCTVNALTCWRAAAAFPCSHTKQSLRQVGNTRMPELESMQRVLLRRRGRVSREERRAEKEHRRYDDVLMSA